MAKWGSDDHKAHASLAAKTSHNARNIDNTMAVVQKLAADVETLKADVSEVKRDVKVAKSTWMRDQANRP